MSSWTARLAGVVIVGARAGDGGPAAVVRPNLAVPLGRGGRRREGQDEKGASEHDHSYEGDLRIRQPDATKRSDNVITSRQARDLAVGGSNGEIPRYARDDSVAAFINK